MAIQFDAASENHSNSTTTLTTSHTVGGSDRLLIVGTIAREVTPPVVTGVTFNTVALTQLTSVDQGNMVLRFWSLVAPDTGAHDIVVSLNAANRVAMVAASYTGIHQTTFFGTHATDFDLSVDVSSATDELVVSLGGVETNNPATGSAFTVGADQTDRNQRQTTSGANEYGICLSDEPGAATVTASYTHDSTLAADGIIAVPLKPAAAGAGPTLVQVNRKFPRGVRRGMRS